MGHDEAEARNGLKRRKRRGSAVGPRWKTVTGSGRIQCIRGEGENPQICPQRVLFEFAEPTPLDLEVTLSPNQCSDVYIEMEWLNDGTPYSWSGQRLRPGQTARLPREIVQAVTRLAFYAIGAQGGCNDGSLGGWRYSYRLTIPRESTVHEVG